jgi:MFS family permease
LQSCARSGDNAATVVTHPQDGAPGGGLVNRLVAAEGVSRIGDAVTVVALPLTAVLVLGASPLELALIGAAQALPILLLSLPVGAWVDGRSRRWPIIVAADLGRAMLILGVPGAAALGILSVPLLAFIALLVSAWGTFFDLAYAGWIPRIVAGDVLHRTNARLELVRSSAAATGPVLGGFLVGILSAPMALAADALSFVASAALVASIRRDEPALSSSPSPDDRSRLLAGVRFIAGQPVIRAITATAGINNLTRAIAMSIAVLYLVDVAKLSAPAIGLAFAVGSSGYVVGAFASRALTARLGVGRTMQLGVGVFGPSMLLFALSPPSLAGPAFAAMAFAHGFGIAVHNVNQVTLRQILTPDALRARVAAVFRLVIFGAMPVGTMLGGVLGELFGLRSALLVSAAGLVVGSVPYALLRVVRIRTIEEVAATQRA